MNDFWDRVHHPKYSKGEPDRLQAERGELSKPNEKVEQLARLQSVQRVLQQRASAGIGLRPRAAKDLLRAVDSCPLYPKFQRYLRNLVT